MNNRTTNVYSTFLDNLYAENIRAAWMLESMKYNLMARTGLDEGDALEVVSKIVAVSHESAANQQVSEFTKLHQGA